MQIFDQDVDGDQSARDVHSKRQKCGDEFAGLKVHPAQGEGQHGGTDQPEDRADDRAQDRNFESGHQPGIGKDRLIVLEGEHTGKTVIPPLMLSVESLKEIASTFKKDITWL